MWIVIWAVVVGGVFAWLWRAGHLARLTAYVQATREELRKCTWPTWEELKGSTIVVAISIFLLAGLLLRSIRFSFAYSFYLNFRSCKASGS